MNTRSNPNLRLLLCESFRVCADQLCCSDKHVAHDNHSISHQPKSCILNEDDATATLANYELVTPRESQIYAGSVFWPHCLNPRVESQKGRTPPSAHLSPWL